MAASMIPATGGQSGTASLIGGLAGLDSGNDDELKPRYYDPSIYYRAHGLSKLIKPKDIQAAYDEFKSLYAQNTPLATANASYYDQLTKGIYEDKTTPNSIAGEYLNTVGDYINRGRNDLGNQAQSMANVDAMRMGLGNTVPSTANSIALATRLGGLFAPLYGQGLASAAPFANTSYGQQKAWDQYRLGQFQTDPLTRYYDQAAYRSLEPLNQLYGGVNRATDALGNVLNRVMIPNVAGYDLEAGLGTRLNNSAAGVMNAMNFATSMYGNIAGMGGGGGGMTQPQQQQFQQSGFNAAQSYQPQSNPWLQNYYPQGGGGGGSATPNLWNAPQWNTMPPPQQWSPGNYTPPPTLGYNYHPGLSTYYA